MGGTAIIPCTSLHPASFRAILHSSIVVWDACKQQHYPASVFFGHLFSECKNKNGWNEKTCSFGSNLSLRLYLIALGLTVRDKESKALSHYSLLLRAVLCLPNLVITFPSPTGFCTEDFLQNIAVGPLPSSPCSSALDIKM